MIDPSSRRPLDVRAMLLLQCGSYFISLSSLIYSIFSIVNPILSQNPQDVKFFFGVFAFGPDGSSSLPLTRHPLIPVTSSSAEVPGVREPHSSRGPESDHGSPSGRYRVF